MDVSERRPVYNLNVASLRGFAICREQEVIPALKIIYREEAR